jgi:hypothetical protein
MVDVVQIEQFAPTLFPFNKYQREGSAAVPWGQAVIDGAFTANAIGVGDTGTLAIDFNLPGNYCCLLRSLHVSAVSPSLINWIRGTIGMAYQLPGGPYKNTMAALPESEFLWWPFAESTLIQMRDRNSVVNYTKTWSVSEISSTLDSGARAGPGLDNPMNIPMWISPDYPGSNVVIYIINSTASSAAVDFRVNAVFDIYDQQQAFAPEVMASPRRLAT